ncbi:homeobox-domain-containing protein, partial [Clavulina sp. PMI_390]
RKRGRVNPSQLAFLERAYLADRSLDAARRRDISQKLGMDERQTQIWFQNRRAKAKLLAHRAKEAQSDVHPSLNHYHSAIPPLEAIHLALQEDPPITVVPCSDVLIGKWRRMNTGSNDLLVYLSEARRELTYFVRSAEMGFKMRIPFDSILSTEYTSDLAPGCDRAVFILSKPPTFYREVLSRAASLNQNSTPSGSGRTWRPANDWTEGAQASTCTRHEITGPAGQL